MIFALPMLLMIFFQTMICMNNHYSQMIKDSGPKTIEPHFHESFTRIQRRKLSSFDHVQHKPLGLTPQDTYLDNKPNSIGQRESEHTLIQRALTKINASLTDFTNKQLGYSVNSSLNYLSEDELKQVAVAVLNHHTAKDIKQPNTELIQRLELHLKKIIKLGVDIFDIKNDKGIDIFTYAVNKTQVNVVQALINISESNATEYKISHKTIKKILQTNPTLKQLLENAKTKALAHPLKFVLQTNSDYSPL